MAIMLLLSAQWLCAQSSDYEIRYLGFREGLKDRCVTAICHDTRGPVWIGTKNGLLRYDGHEIAPFQLDSSGVVFNIQGFYISQVLQDADQNIWVATGGKLFVIEYDLQHVVEFGNVISLVLDEKKQIYASLGKGEVVRLELCHEKHKKWVKKTKTPLRGEFLFRKEGTSGIWSYDLATGKVRMMTESRIQELPHLLPNDSWFTYLNYGTGVLNLFTSQEAFALNQTSLTFQPLPKSSNEINNPFCLRDRFNDFARKNPALLSGEIAGIIPMPYCVEPDRHGNLWAGTEYGLFIVMKRGSGFKHLDVLRGQSPRAMYKEGDTLLISSSFGRILRINLKTGKIVDYAEPSAAIRVILPFDEHRYLLAGDYDGLLVMEKKCMKLSEMYLNDQIKHQAAGIQLDNGEIWLGGLNTSICPLKPDFSCKEIPFPEAQRPRIMSVIKGKGDVVWTGGESCLYRIENHVFSKNLISGINKEVQITCMLELGDRLWLGTRGDGLYCFDIQSGQIIRNFNTVDGLPNDILNSLLPDRDSNLWISTNQGISCFNPASLKFINFSERDGLEIEEFNMSSFLRDPENGILYFGGLNGVTWFDPSEIKKVSTIPEVFISKILRPGEEEGKTNALYPTSEAIKVELEATARYIEFHLGSTDYSDPQKNIFLHKLQGFDNDWVSGGNNPVLQYNTLPAGDYHLCVLTINRDGNSSKEKCLWIHVKQVFYKTWWFRGLIIFSILTILLAYYLNKIRQFNQIIQVKKQIADDLHDDVAASLSQISMLVKSLREKEGTDTALERIENLSDESIGKLGDIVWAIDDKPQTLEALANRLQDHAEAVFFPLGIRLKAEIRITGLEGNVASAVRHHVMMIFKEAVSNIIKHTESTAVFIRIESQRKGLTLVVENRFERVRNGAPSTGKGLISMEKRAGLLNGTLKFEKTAQSFILILHVPDIFEKKTL